MKMTNQAPRLWSVIMMGTLLNVLTQSIFAAPKSDLWAFWDNHDSANHLKIDHSDWQRFLSEYVFADEDGHHLVAYNEVSEEHSKQLNEYITKLTKLDISTYQRDEQMAYWINLYNALTVQVILKHYPIDSILDIDISPGLFSNGPWGAKLVTINGQGVSLDDIEHRILRPIWADPRVHYAVNCASIGCPNLATEAYQRKTLETQLNRAAKAFINSTKGVSFDDNGELTLSKIYDWFADDFGENEQDLINHLKLFSRQDLKDKLNTFDGDIDYEYDWAINAKR